MSTKYREIGGGGGGGGGAGQGVGGEGGEEEEEQRLEYVPDKQQCTDIVVMLTIIAPFTPVPLSLSARSSISMSLSHSITL